MERENNNTVIAVVITILVMIILGFVAYFVYDKFLIDNNEPNTEENNKLETNKNEKEEVKPIEVTNALEEELRGLIPTVRYCNKYLAKQYNGSVFKASDLTDEDKTSDFNECQMTLAYSLPYKKESIEDEVYLYDYILLYNYEKSDLCDYCNFGKDYNNLNINGNYIEWVEDRDEISEKSLKEYGQIYKYTFKLVDGNYEYVSTEAVK